MFMTIFMIKKRYDRRKELGIIDDITWGHKKARAFGLEEATVYSISLTQGTFVWWEFDLILIWFDLILI